MSKKEHNPKHWKVFFALDELLRIKEHGNINRLAKSLKIPRDTLTKYIENRSVYINMNHLSALCDYAVTHSGVDPSMLPGALFRYQSSEIWPLLTERESIEISMGIRMGETFKDPWVALADSKLKDSVSDGMNCRTKNSPAGREHYLLAPEKDGSIPTDTIQRVAKIYATFQNDKANRALVCLGSMKSNPLIEYMLAGYLKSAQRFVSEDAVESPEQRSSPVYFLYRDYDPHPSSAWGGSQLSRKIPGKAPGIYYEDEQGHWTCCPCSEDEDAAMVFYRRHKASGQVEMILGGFSSYASHALAWLLAQDEPLWEPVYSHHGVDIGMYVVRFQKADNDTSTAPDIKPPKKHQVIGLHASTISRRFRIRPVKTTAKENPVND